jgi:hypothetical protein
MNDELLAAAEHLERYGYCLLEDRIPAAQAHGMAADFLQLHADPQYAQYISGDEHYQTLFGMLNYDERVWQCAFHADTVALGRHFLGPRCRVVEACSKPCWPGAPAQNLHVDSAGNFHQVPDMPWMINSIWMLSDFTVENGATGIVPMSHRSRLKAPPPEIGHDSELIQPVTGRAGSVLLWHAGAFHQVRANTSDQIRMGLNIAYYPRWLNNWIEGWHQPLWPETYARMSAEMQEMCVKLHGHERDAMYEKR